MTVGFRSGAGRRGVGRGTAGTAARRLVLVGWMHVVMPLVAYGSMDSLWQRSNTSYGFNATAITERFAPDHETPLRAVYDAMSAIAQRDGEALVGLFVDEAHPNLRDVVRLWAPRLQDRTLELRRLYSAEETRDMKELKGLR